MNKSWTSHEQVMDKSWTMVQNFGSQNILSSKRFWVKQIKVKNKFLDKNNFALEKILSPKFFWILDLFQIYLTQLDHYHHYHYQIHDIGAATLNQVQWALNFEGDLDLLSLYSSSPIFLWFLGYLNKFWLSLSVFR